ncbi:MAG: hypothetical protein K0S33_3467 [Bacteroidetes bacterium]|jgi:hypothetical protein|nr:hypothetical protein [Bacteroidota bacterium]
MIKSPLEDIQFPQYRKYSNNKNYFRILSPVEFEEIQLIGSRQLKRKVTAELFPEKNFIMDLLLLNSPDIVVIDAAEFGKQED